MADESAPVDHIVALVPQSEREVLGEFPPVLAAQEECEELNAVDKMAEMSEVTVLADGEVGKKQVIELFGPKARLDIPCRCELPYLCLQLRDMNRFLSFEFHVVDHERRVRRFLISNRQSTARVQAQAASLPMELKKGTWNYINVDLADLTQRAFGTMYQRCKLVAVNSTCRILRIFFQDRAYEDVELPHFLRVVK